MADRLERRSHPRLHTRPLFTSAGVGSLSRFFDFPLGSNPPSFKESAASFRRDLCARTQTNNNKPQRLSLKGPKRFLLSCACLQFTFPSICGEGGPTLRSTQNQMLRRDPANIPLPNLHSDWSKCPGHSQSDTIFRRHVNREDLVLSFSGILSFHPNPPAAWISDDAG